MSNTSVYPTLKGVEELNQRSQDLNLIWISEIRNIHINIGTGKEISIKELAAVIKKTVGFQGELVFIPQNPMDNELYHLLKLAALVLNIPLSWK